MRKKMRNTLTVSLVTTMGCAMLATGAFLFMPEKAPAADPLKPLYKGTFYSATRGGHMVFTDITIDPNRDMVSGSIAGRLEIPNNESADAIQMSQDKKYIFYPTWDESMLYTIDIQDRKNPKVLAETKIFPEATKHCGSQIGADGKMYLSSMALGDVHTVDVSDPLEPKLMDRGYKTTYLCNVQSLTGDRILTTDMKDHKLYLYDTKTAKQLKELKPGGDEFLHRGQLSPDGKTLYQSSTGSLGDGVHSGRIYEVDTDTLKVKDTIVVGANYDMHDAITTPDGKYLIAAARRTPQPQFMDSEYVVVNLETKKTIGTVSMCAGCHNANKVVPELAKGREVFICGIQVAWE
ncbi:MAG: WD40 repeat domain-containing protein [Desulfoarculaceae bacterium]|nr:WD40 repeat domain-containing protein [Desulfoarculaceae bacterium]